MYRYSLFVLVLCLGFAVVQPARAQVTQTLRHSLFDPGTNAQADAAEGFSVAMDGNLAVVGAPEDNVGGEDSGIVNVYDATTGIRLHVLVNPSPGLDDRFGYAVAISGTRVVVGAPKDDTGAANAGRAYVYDLAGATPTVPILILDNPHPAVEDWFGAAVAISGNRLVVGVWRDDAGATDAGRAYVYNLSSGTPAVPLHTLNNPSPWPSDHFGMAVSISEGRVVVGAPEDNTGDNNAGSVYVYNIDGPTPLVPAVTLSHPNSMEDAIFGSAVAVSGARLVVGANGESFGAFLAGRAYVYDLAGATPTVPIHMLNNPSPVDYERFAEAVAIEGQRVVIGARSDSTGASGAGSAYVYNLAGASPTIPTATLNNPHPAPGDWFGWSVAVSGTRVLAGAFRDDLGATDSGSAYVYDMAIAMATVPVRTLVNSRRAESTYFGDSVVVSGRWMAVGVSEDDTGAIDAGRVYVYDLTSATPRVPVFSLGRPIPEPYDYFGSRLAISGSRVVVGLYRDSSVAIESGRAYVYDLANPTPTVPVATLVNPSPAAEDYFGHSVGISGTKIVVGAQGDDAGAVNAGIAYIYDLSGGTPTVPALTLNNPSPAMHDFFGQSVAISGTRVVVGAIRDDTGALDAGSAYVYDLAGATPAVPVATLNNPTPEADDEFGYSVGISGPWVVVGAPFDDTGASDAGRAYVYNLAGPTPALPFATLNNPNPSLGDFFGLAPAISGTRVVMGVAREHGPAFAVGIAYVYEMTGATPTVPVTTLLNPSPALSDSFGYSVAIDGATIVVGAPADDANAMDRGAAYVFGVAPAFHVAPAAPGFLTLSWSTESSAGFVLQCTDSLSPANWVNAPSGAMNPVTVPTTGGHKFYRLFHP